MGSTRKWLAIVLSCLVLVSPVGTAYAKQGKKLVIGVPMYIATHDWSMHVWNGIEEMGRKLGVELIKTSAERDITKHMADIENAIQQKVDGLIIVLGDTASLEVAVEKAAAARIPVIYVDGGLRVPGLTMNISSDNIQIGRDSMEWLIKTIGGKGNIVMFGYPQLECTRLREVGAREVLEKHPEVKVLEYHALAMGSPVVEKSMQIMEGILRKYPKKGQIQGIWAPADTCGGLGPAAACDREGRTEIIISSTDCLKEAAELIRSGKSSFRASVSQRPREMGRLAVEMMVRKIEGEREVPSTIFVPTLIYTRENIPPAGQKTISDL